MQYDCIIVGAGPAGLHCGTYLGRFDRHVIVFNGGKPRAAWIPVTHNFPGFPEGITGNELLARLHRQCDLCGTAVVDEEVLSVEGADGNFTVKTSQTEARAKKIVLAMGVFDIPPHIPDPEHYKGGTIRHCAICDAYEARRQKLVIFGTGNHVATQALWLSHYTDDLTILTTGDGTLEDIDPRLRKILQSAHIALIHQKVVAIHEEEGQLGTIVFEDGSKIEDVYRGYSAMGLKANSELARAMGVRLDVHGYIEVHGQQETNIHGVYAIGDIVADQIGQLSIAVGNASAAATAIHNSLLEF